MRCAIVYSLLGFLTAGVTLRADAPAGKSREKLYVTNSQGDDVTVIDVATNRVLHTIKVGRQPHGIAVPAARNVIYVSIEGTTPGQLVWIDPGTDRVVRRMDTGPRPNQLAVTPDGKQVYLPVDNGTYEVIDTAAGRIVDRIRTGGRPHNTVCSADGRHMYLAPMARTGGDNPRLVTIVDVGTRTVVGRLTFSDAVRPVALSADETRFYANIDNLIGMEVFDVPARRLLYRVAADIPPAQKDHRSRTHGIAIRPDQKEVWTCDVHNRQVYVFDVTGAAPRQTATIPMEGDVYWLTFTADGKTAYVSVLARNLVVAVDTASRKITARIPVGKSPKRLVTVRMPD